MIELTINYVTKVVCSVGVFEVRDKAHKTNKLFFKAKKAAADKKLHEAIEHSDLLFKLWSSNPSFWEKLFRGWFLTIDLLEAEKSLKKWKKNLHQANQLINEGKKALKIVSKNPKETQSLISGIEYLEQAQILLFDTALCQEINSAKVELEKRQTWVQLVEEAHHLEQTKYFKKALSRYRQSQDLYLTKTVQSKILRCQKYADVEQEYVKRMKAAQYFCSTGNFHKAYKISKDTLNKFSRDDGKQFYQEVLKILKSKKAFLSGLHAEQKQDFEHAMNFYADACNYLSAINGYYEANEYCSENQYQLRQAIVAYKQSRWQLAEDLLRGLTNDRAKYLRGLVFIQQSKYEAAKSAWHNLKLESLPEQRSKLDVLSQSAYLKALQKIENYVDAGALPIAIKVSQETINNFPEANLVKQNLSRHILPRLEVETWQKSDIDWHSFSDKLQADFLQDTTIKSLHNWAVAMYYCVINEPKPDYDLLYRFNASWSMAIANLPDDPALENLLWRESQSVDFKQLKEKLEVLWDNALETVKEQNLNLYLEIRDWQRLDRYTLRELEFPITKGFYIKNLWISPSAKELLENLNYEIQQDYFLPSSVIPDLYTCFGRSLAAFLEGDTKRGVLLKSYIPNKTFKGAENQASTTTTYFEVCHLLKQKHWRLAFDKLSPISAVIKSNSEWLKNIDTLCEKIIHDLKDNVKIDFASRWSELLNSQASRHHFLEIQMNKIRQDIADERISPSSGLSKLRDLKKMDAKNPMLLDLINRVESIVVRQEFGEKIDRSFRQGDIDGAVRYAVQSGNAELRQEVAQIIFKIFQENQHIFSYQDTLKFQQWINRLL
jgi:hypothetical protein